MAQENPNRLVEWYLVLRRQGPALRQHLEDWVAAVKEEPRLIWETATVRYAAYGVGGLLSVWLVTWLGAALAPPPPADAKPQATTADFHVICTNPECGEHFVINRKFGFNKFPVACPKCNRESGMAARLCNSSACQGRWVVPALTGDGKRCPICNEPFLE